MPMLIHLELQPLKDINSIFVVILGFSCGPERNSGLWIDEEPL